MTKCCSVTESGLNLCDPMARLPCASLSPEVCSNNQALDCSLEKAMAPHSSTLAWKIPWTEEPGRLRSTGSLKVGQTERLHFHFSLSRVEEGNGNPLQCSCLENPRDRGARWADVYGVAQSQTRLKWLSSSPPGSTVYGVSQDMEFSSIFKNTGVGCHSLLQGIFSTQRLNLHLLHWQADSLPMSHLGNPWSLGYESKVNVHLADSRSVRDPCWGEECRGKCDNSLPAFPHCTARSRHPSSYSSLQSLPCHLPVLSLTSCPLHQQVWWFPQTVRFKIAFSWVSCKVSHPATTLS